MQRMAHCTREGGPAEIQLERYSEALYDPSTNLTYTSLTGVRKQSVSDAERMFSCQLAMYMESKGYTEEANFIKVVADWRAACDERGLSELERSKFNYSLLNYLLGDLMPWHKEYDYIQLLRSQQVRVPCGKIT